VLISESTPDFPHAGAVHYSTQHAPTLGHLLQARRNDFSRGFFDAQLSNCNCRTGLARFLQPRSPTPAPPYKTKPSRSPLPFPLLSHIYDINANTHFISDFINNVDRRVIPSPNNTYDLLKQLHHDWT
jgi:hypothetical protein